jgi:hypothetical protein
MQSVQGNTETFLDDEMRKVERIRDENTADVIERVHVGVPLGVP